MPTSARSRFDIILGFSVSKFQTNLESAELIKYAANSYLATKIAFTNEIAYLCEKLEADVNSVLQGIGLDKRIGAVIVRKVVA